MPQQCQPKAPNLWGVGLLLLASPPLLHELLERERLSAGPSQPKAKRPRAPPPKTGDSPIKRRPTVSPGVTGLRNLGNTCYMNSILQVLSHLHVFRECFLRLDLNQALELLASAVSRKLGLSTQCVPHQKAPTSGQGSAEGPPVRATWSSYNLRSPAPNTSRFVTSYTHCFRWCGQASGLWCLRLQCCTPCGSWSRRSAVMHSRTRRNFFANS